MREVRPAAPCVVCGTTGGYREPRCHRPARTHGHCNACYHTARRDLAPADATCVVCGATYVTRHPGQRTCSRTCGYRHASAAAIARLGDASHPCAVCRAPMFARDFASANDYYQTRFCSDRCRTRWHARHGDRVVVPQGAVTIADLDLTPLELHQRAKVAAAQLALEQQRAELKGYLWAFQHPEQFTPAALLQLFPHPGGLQAGHFVLVAAEAAAEAATQAAALAHPEVA